MHRVKIAYVTTVPMTLSTLCRGQARYMRGRPGFEVLRISSEGELLREFGRGEGAKVHDVRMASRNLQKAREYRCEVRHERRVEFYQRVKEAAEAWERKGAR